MAMSNNVAFANGETPESTAHGIYGSLQINHGTQILLCIAWCTDKQQQLLAGTLSWVGIISCHFQDQQSMASTAFAPSMVSHKAGPRTRLQHPVWNLVLAVTLIMPSWKQSKPLSCHGWLMLSQPRSFKCLMSVWWHYSEVKIIWSTLMNPSQKMSSHLSPWKCGSTVQNWPTMSSWGLTHFAQRHHMLLKSKVVYSSTMLLAQNQIIVWQRQQTQLARFPTWESNSRNKGHKSNGYYAYKCRWGALSLVWGGVWSLQGWDCWYLESSSFHGSVFIENHSSLYKVAQATICNTFARVKLTNLTYQKALCNVNIEAKNWDFMQCNWHWWRTHLQIWCYDKWASYQNIGKALRHKQHCSWNAVISCHGQVKKMGLNRVLPNGKQCCWKVKEMSYKKASTQCIHLVCGLFSFHAW